MLYRLAIDPQQLDNCFLNLLPEQNHYLRRVLRLNKGDRFLVLNGLGEVWIAQLDDRGARILEPVAESKELPTAIFLLVVLPKGSGFEDIVRSTTELGVSTLIPAIGDRSLLKPSANRLQRWRRIAAEAAEQSERQIVPAIFDPLPFARAVEEAQHLSVHRYICATRRSDPHLLTAVPSPLPPSLLLATGCEGGWTPSELDLAVAYQFLPVSLGKRILRAVTAPIAALACLVGEIERDRSVEHSS